LIRYLGLLLLTLVLLFSASVRAETILAIGGDEESVLELSPWLYFTQDNEGEGIDQVRRYSSSQWDRLTSNYSNRIGIAPFWVKFSVYNYEERGADRLLSVANPHLDRIELYHLVKDKVIDKVIMGDNQPFSERPLINNHFIYPFELEPEKLHTFYLKIETEGSATLPMNLWSQEAFAKNIEATSLSHGFQLGALTAIGLFSLFIAITSRSFSYSYYSGYVLSVTLLVATLQGFAFRFLWPSLPALQQIMIPLLVPLTMLFALLFTEKVLQFKYHNVHMLRVCRFGAAYALLLTLTTPFLDYALALYIDIISVLFITVLLMGMAMIQASRGYKLAKLYSLAWSGMLVGAFITGLMYLGFIELPVKHLTPVMLGLLFEILFMAAILAIRYNDERKAKLRIKQEALVQAQRIRQTREEALLIEADSNEKLEQMVQERTLELEIALRELNEANQKLTEQATVDSLTGVKNRAAFDKRLLAEGRLSRRQQTPMAILMLDIDRFKSINDTYGHLAGDQTLRLIAQTLKENLKRPADLVSRFGGEEFAIILPNTAEEGAVLVAELIRKMVAELPISWENATIPLTISIGVSAEIINTENQPNILLEQADKALYRAKNSGRNCVMVYTPEP